MKILYIPLDERPCNYKYPQDIAKSQSDIQFKIIPKGLLGNKKIKADVSKIHEYILNNIDDTDILICSIDMLCYGGLIPSRVHMLGEEELEENLSILKEIKSRNNSLKIYPFTSIMRTPSYNSSDEEPDYYEQYGKNIFDYKYLRDKQKRVGLDKSEEETLNKIEIPKEILEDYETRRETNIEVVKKVVKYLKEDLYSQLVIFQDDSAPYGYTAIDQQTIKNLIQKEGLVSKVFIYPGADEVGASLLLRAYNENKKKVNKVYVEYSSSLGPNIIPLYEDRPMYETLKWHLHVTNSIIVDDYKEADYILIVSSPGKLMQESWDQFENRDRTYDANRNLLYIVDKIKYYIDNNKRVMIADVAYANGGDYELISLLDEYNLLDKIYSYSGWNTHANTLGTTLAQGMISESLNYETIKNNITHLLEDCFYQAIVRMDITKNFLPKHNLNYFDLKDKQDLVIDEEIKYIKELYSKLNISKQYPLTKLEIKHPWNRMFEISLNIDLDKKYTEQEFDIDELKGAFIVSTQALEDEPLNSSYIMSKMAKAAIVGGANAIRANSKDDIAAIQKEVSTPIIGIVKRDYVGSEVYITPTMKEVEELISVNVDIIAIDATQRIRPNNQTLQEFVKEIKLKYPKQKLMADCATQEDVKGALDLDFDIISSTLVGYTQESKGDKIESDDFKILKKMLKLTHDKNKFFIAEGNIDSPQKVKRVFEMGVDATVVGSMITRPQLITKKFTANLAEETHFLNIDEEIDTSKYSSKCVVCITQKDLAYAKNYAIENDLFSNIFIVNGGKKIAYKNNTIICEGLNTCEAAINYLVENKYINQGE